METFFRASRPIVDPPLPIKNGAVRPMPGSGQTNPEPTRVQAECPLYRLALLAEA